MDKVLKKWLNNNYFWPLGTIVIDTVLFYGHYDKVALLVEKLKKILNFDFLFISTSKIPHDKLSEIPKDSLALKLEDNKLDLKSIDLITANNNSSHFDILVILKKNKLHFNSVLKLFINYALLNSLLLLSLCFVLLTILSYIYISDIRPIQYVLPFQILSFTLLSSLSNTKPTKLMSNICSLNSGKNKCIQLKNATRKIFGYFEFHELGIMYFATLISVNIYYGFELLTNSITPILLLLIFVGFLIAIYSIFIQVSNRTYCPICLFVVIVCLLQTIVLFSTVDLHANISPILLLSFISLLCMFFIVVLNISRIQQISLENFDYQNYITSLVKLSKSQVLSDKEGREILKTIGGVSFSNESRIDSRKHDLHIFSSLDCQACSIFSNDLIENIDYENYNLYYYFGLLSQDNTFIDDPKFDLYVVLGYLLSKDSFENYLEASRIIFQENMDTEKCLTKIYSDFNIPDINELTDIKSKLIMQNKIMERENLIYFPTVILNEALIPSYIKPRYYTYLLE